MSTMTVRPLGGDRFAIEGRGHCVVVDQPVADGGRDEGFTPTELFVAGLGACVAHYAHRYLARHHIDPTGMRVQTDFAFAPDTPARVARIDVVLEPPLALPESRRDAFLAVASHCTVHNTLVTGPDVSVSLAHAPR